jgi:hypothetical protein
VIEIRSYRRVFDLERRIYRIDRFRLVPGGVPIRGVAYFLVAVFTVLVSSRAPLLGAPLRALPWYVTYVAAPVVCALVLGVVQIEGRPFHTAVVALSLGWTEAHAPARALARDAAGHWQPDDLIVLPDGSDARMRALRYTGPGTVVVTVAHELGGSVRATRRRPRLRSSWSVVTMKRPPGAVRPPKATVIALAAGTRMRVVAGETGKARRAPHRR